MPTVLRFFQRDAIEAVREAWREFRTVLVTMGTGAGKLTLASKQIEECCKIGRCLFAADRDELLRQPLERFNKVSGLIPALEQASNKASLASRVVVGSIQTLSRPNRIERFPRDHFGYVFVDEAHRNSDLAAEIINYFDQAKVCAYTATPFRAGLKSLSKYYETVAYKMPMVDLEGNSMGLIEQGFAPKMKIVTLPVEIDLSAVKQSQTTDGRDFNATELAGTMAPYFEQIVDLLKEHVPNCQIIASLPLIALSKDFALICRSKGISARHVDGKSEDRHEIIQAFGLKRFQLICCAELLSTGVDIPTADCYLNLSPTRSAVRYQQFVGRVMRVLPGVIDHLPEKDQAEERKACIAASAKPHATILDMLFQDAELGVMRPGDLVANSEEEAQAIYAESKKVRTPEDLQEIARKVLEDREQQLVKRLEKAAAQAGGKILSVEHVGAILHSKKLLHYTPVSRWEEKALSDPQSQLLTKFGINPQGIETKGAASVLIGELISRRNLGLCTFKQANYLRELGHPNPELVKFSEASIEISKLKMARMLTV